MRSPASRPLVISTSSPTTCPVVTTRSSARIVGDHEHAGGAGDRPDGRGRHEQRRRFAACSMRAVAKNPGFRRPSSFGTSASTTSARDSALSAGET